MTHAKEDILLRTFSRLSDIRLCSVEFLEQHFQYLGSVL